MEVVKKKVIVFNQIKELVEKMNINALISPVFQVGMIVPKIKYVKLVLAFVIMENVKNLAKIILIVIHINIIVQMEIM
jgi:hypothetical protein